MPERTRRGGFVGGGIAGRRAVSRWTQPSNLYNLVTGGSLRECPLVAARLTPTNADTSVRSPLRGSLPLDRAGGFGGDVVRDTIHTIHFIHDA